jgi:transposase-like protein
MEADMTTNAAASMDFWRATIREQAESGMTVGEYCQLIEKSTYQFYYWKRRVEKGTAQADDSRNMDAGEFIELRPLRIDTVNRYERSDSVDIRVGSFLVRFTETTDRALFKMAVSLLLEIAE